MAELGPIGHRDKNPAENCFAAATPYLPFVVAGLDPIGAKIAGKCPA
jgi:hypothetical protein